MVKTVKRLNCSQAVAMTLKHIPDLSIHPASRERVAQQFPVEPLGGGGGMAVFLYFFPWRPHVGFSGFCRSDGKQ